MLQLFEHERTGTLADHETVAVLVERTRSVPGIVVAGGEGLHRIETADRRLVNRSLRTARNHDIGLAVTDGLQSGDKTVVGRSARRDGAVIGTHETVLHGDESGSDVGNHAGNEERAKPRGHTPLGVAQTFVEERFESSDTRSPDYACALLVELVEIERRVLDGLRGRDEGILREKVVLAYLLAVEILVRVVIFHFTGKTGLEFFGVEVSNGRGTADTFLQIPEILLDIIAERVDRTDTRDDYSSFCHKTKNLIVV